MDFGASTLMQMARTSMRYNTQRQAELGRNIANIDTPGYGARDLKPLDFGQMAESEASRLELRSTAPSHMQGFNPFKGPFNDDLQRSTFESTPVNNNIVLEQQMAKVNETGLNFQLASNIYRKMQGMFKTAIGAARG